MSPFSAKKCQLSPALLVAIAALVVALGGVAYATIPDSGGVIHGCYDKGGKLSVIDTNAGQGCKNNETALNWNQTGPQGQPGPQGPQGPAGPSDVFWKTGGMYVPDNPLPGAFPIVLQLDNLPPGEYLVTSNVKFTTTIHTVLACRYVDANYRVGPIESQEIANPQPGQLVMTMLPLQTPVDLPSGGDIRIQCYSNPFDYSQSGPNDTRAGGFISAMKVGTLTGQ